MPAYIKKVQQAAELLAQNEARLLAEMHSVLSISRALVGEIDVNKVLELITAQAKHLANAVGAAVILLDEEGQWLQIITADNRSSQSKEELSLFNARVISRAIIDHP